jgi:hypothetical protein
MRADSAVEPTKVGKHYSDLAAFAVFWRALGVPDVVLASTDGVLPLASSRRAAIIKATLKPAISKASSG